LGEQRSFEQHMPPLAHLFIAPAVYFSGIDVQHCMVVVAHYLLGARHKRRLRRSIPVQAGGLQSAGAAVLVAVFREIVPLTEGPAFAA